jgi:hypothetical protein
VHFGGKTFRRHTSSFSALDPIRFRGCAILLVAVLVFAAAPARGQAPAPDSSEKADKSDKQAPHDEQTTQPDQENPPNAPNPPSLLTPLKEQKQNAAYVPITARQRLRWLITNTIGPPHLAGGTITSAFGTALDRPREDGPHWGGFAERFGVRLTGVATSNVMEAGIGSLWGEDPRYFRVPEYSFGARVKHVVTTTFLARRRDGTFAPAYARYIAFSGNNFLSNAWRPDSEANVHDAVLRTLEGFAGRMASNAWEEFWPQAKTYMFHHAQH